MAGQGSQSGRTGQIFCQQLARSIVKRNETQFTAACAINLAQAEYFKLADDAYQLYVGAISYQHAGTQQGT